MSKLEETEPFLDAVDDEKDRKYNEEDTASEDDSDVRFNPPAPSPWKRVALIAMVLLLFYFGIQLRAASISKAKPQIIYASRYSKEHKFRPAASPIITETLKDGRIRLRGANPTATPTPTKTPPVKKRSTKAGRASGKRKRKPSGPRK